MSEQPEQVSHESEQPIMVPLKQVVGKDGGETILRHDSTPHEHR